MFEQRIENSLKLLDEVWGSRQAWRSRITPEHLLMNSCYECLLGQLYGDFDDAPASFQKESQEYAFYLDNQSVIAFRQWEVEQGREASLLSFHAAYEELANQWRKVLA